MTISTVRSVPQVHGGAALSDSGLQARPSPALAQAFTVTAARNSMAASTQPVQRFDNPKPLFPGEHWVDLAVGLVAWFATKKNPSLAVRTLGTFVAATLVARASHGHRRMSQVFKLTPIGGGIKRD
jgi:hypothetical protein